MKLMFEEVFDRYLEDPDNEKRIKKAEYHVKALADKLFSSSEDPVLVDVNGYYYPDGSSVFSTRYFISGTGQVLDKDYDRFGRFDNIKVQILDPGFNTESGQILIIPKNITNKI